MPRIPNDFTKEMMFYIIKCNNLELTDVYIGSTFNFTNRKSEHKKKSTHHHYKIYQYIRENGGWDNFNMTLIERRICRDMLEARQYEQHLIEQHKSSLNTIKAFRKETKKEADHLTYLKYAEQYKEKHNKYYTENEDTIKAYQKQYRLEHIDTQQNYNKEYRLKNLTELRESERKRSQLRRDKIKEQSLLKC